MGRVTGLWSSRTLSPEPTPRAPLPTAPPACAPRLLLRHFPQGIHSGAPLGTAGAHLALTVRAGLDTAGRSPVQEGDWRQGRKQGIQVALRQEFLRQELGRHQVPRRRKLHRDSNAQQPDSGKALPSNQSTHTTRGGAPGRRLITNKSEQPAASDRAPGSPIPGRGQSTITGAGEGGWRVEADPLRGVLGPGCGGGVHTVRSSLARGGGPAGEEGCCRTRPAANRVSEAGRGDLCPP